MSNVIEFPKQERTTAIARPSGQVAVFLEKDGMVTIDAHVSAARDVRYCNKPQQLIRDAFCRTYLKRVLPQAFLGPRIVMNTASLFVIYSKIREPTSKYIRQMLWRGAARLQMWSATITNGAAVKARLGISAAAMFLLSAFTQAELETAKNTKEHFKDGYWKCLATEIVRVVPTNMSTQEFSLFAKGACRKERSEFFVSLSDYIVMLHPDVDRDTVVSAANIAVKAAQDDAVKVLVDLRSANKAK
jgi:hypothetical protein